MKFFSTFFVGTVILSALSLMTVPAESGCGILTECESLFSATICKHKEGNALWEKVKHHRKQIFKLDNAIINEDEVPIDDQMNLQNSPQLIARQQNAEQINKRIRYIMKAHCSKMGRALRRLVLMEHDKIARILSENKVRAWVEKKENGLKFEQAVDIMRVFLDETLLIRRTS